MSDYYALLSSLSAAVNTPLADLSTRLSVPILSALLLGLIGAVAPCQLTTNVVALAYVSRNLDSGDRLWRSALAYAAGKVAVYSAIGVCMVLLGWQLSSNAVPVVVAVRKVLGPMLIVFGLFSLGLFRLNFTFGQRLSSWLESRGGKSTRSSFLLGVAFAFAFCPTLFLLFFGLLIPLSISSRGGIVLPSIFALGLTVPLLALAFVGSIVADNIGAYVDRAKRVERIARPVIAIVFILAGINETIVYLLFSFN